MDKISVLSALRALERPAFTTREVALLSGHALSSVSQSLKRLEKQGLITRMKNGVWADTRDARFTPFALTGLLVPSHPVYLSFVSALHLHGVISQIPQVITVASTAHSGTVRTPAGTYLIHRIDPSFFAGFDWYRGTGEFLIAEPEKALADCLYIAGRKGKRYGFFPELNLKVLKKRKVQNWINRIPGRAIRQSALLKLERLFAAR